jgi:phytoene dehydrogenase-like protein
MRRERYDAVVVGGGPNGLAAALALAQTGRSVLVVEANDRIGGGARTEELTLPGFLHDRCSAIHPLGVASPFFATLPLSDCGLDWVHPAVPVAHPLEDGTAGVLARSVDETAEQMGVDRTAWRRVIGPLADGFSKLSDAFLGPVARPPAHPVTMARFGLAGIWPATGLARRVFRTEQARAALAGMAAHALVPLERPLTAAVGLLFAASAHGVGWPAARGGSDRIAEALGRHLGSLGGEIVTGEAVRSLAQLPPTKVVLFDLSPRQILDIAGERLSSQETKRLSRFRYGNAVFKIDYALDGPVPWKADACLRAGTVHVGGTLEEVAAAERDVAAGRHPQRPFVLVAQQSLFDPTRAPPGKHTLWAYCHVPHGSRVDMTEAVEAQLERFAPGFRDLVLSRHVSFPADLERHDANYIDGDIAGGSAAGLQMLFRPTLSLDPYRLGRDLYICSASSPPGPGVHGMCGWWGARSALRHSW